jgi:hypothetical protein
MVWAHEQTLMTLLLTVVRIVMLVIGQWAKNYKTQAIHLSLFYHIIKCVT